MVDIEQNKREFLSIATKNIKRKGIKKLLEWLELGDFYVAPASTRFHGDYTGGLVEHKIDVYNNLVALNKIFHLTGKKDTIAIISLFHDLTKIDCYKSDFRNVKNESGVWERVPYFAFDEQFAFGGHGSKSVYLIQKFMQLTDEEAVCINTHMGAFDRPNGDYSLGNAWRMFPLAALLHCADLMSNYNDKPVEIKVKKDPLKEAIDDLVILCKSIIDNGANKDDVYAMIATHNNNIMNPNAIRELDTAKTIIKNLKGTFDWQTQKTKKPSQPKP